MRIQFDGFDYDYEPGSITVMEAIAIRNHTGKGVVDWGRSIGETDPESLQALMWLIKSRNGQPCAMADLDFDIVKFMNAYAAGAAAEKPVVEAGPKARSSGRKNRDSMET